MTPRIMNRTAACCCGQLRIVCQGEPTNVALCHCIACQRRTGAPFGIAAFYDRDLASPTGASTCYSRASDRGHSVEFHFCGSCGSTVYWYPERLPDFVAVAVGAFGDPDFPMPAKSVHGSTRHGWVVVPEFTNPAAPSG